MRGDEIRIPADAGRSYHSVGRAADVGPPGVTPTAMLAWLEAAMRRTAEQSVECGEVDVRHAGHQCVRPRRHPYQHRCECCHVWGQSG